MGIFVTTGNDISTLSTGTELGQTVSQLHRLVVLFSFSDFLSIGVGELAVFGALVATSYCRSGQDLPLLKYSTQVSKFFSFC